MFGRLTSGIRSPWSENHRAIEHDDNEMQCERSHHMQDPAILGLLPNLAPIISTGR